MTFGRATRSGPIDAFGIACERKGKRKPGEALGLIPVVGSLAMAIGYTVVMGWILKYTVGAFTGATLAPADVDEFSAVFGSMASAFGNTGWQVVILLAAMGILMFGVGGGIEKVNKVLMPVFFLLFVGLGIYVAFQPGAVDGYLPCGWQGAWRSENVDFCPGTGIFLPFGGGKRNTDLWILSVG